jgi:hypothetical protein
MADKLNYVNVGPYGTFAPSGELHTTPADVDAIFAHLEQQGKKKLTIHFHGGLIKEEAGRKIAEKMSLVYTQAGSHPVTFIWETGLMETVKRNLESINQTKLFVKLLKLVLRLAGKQLGGVGGKGPGQAISEAEIEAELAKEDRFDQFDAGARGGAALLTVEDLDQTMTEIEAELEEELDVDPEIEDLLAREAPQTMLLDQKLPAMVDEEKGKGIGTAITIAKVLGQIVYRVIRRFIEKRDHGFYPTVVEEILRELYVADAGEWVWGGMKTAAEQMWLSNENLQGNNRHAGLYFLSGLVSLQQRMPALTVDLVGHSAGSIAICEMFRALAREQYNLRIRNVIFLAPACTADLFTKQIVDHPERFQQFRMFTMRDDFECRDRLMSPVYTRSLLYFIAGALEGAFDMPVAGMERYFHGNDPYTEAGLVRAGKFLHHAGAERLVLSNTHTTAPNAADGFRSGSEKHGDFDDDGLTQASLIYTIKQ